MSDLFISNVDVIGLITVSDKALQMLPDVLRNVIYDYWKPDMLHDFFLDQHMFPTGQYFWPVFWLWEDGAERAGWRIEYNSDGNNGLQMCIERGMENVVRWRISHIEILWNYLIGQDPHMLQPSIKKLAPEMSTKEIEAVEKYFYTGLRRGILQDATQYWFVLAARERGLWNPNDKSISSCTHQMRCSWWGECPDIVGYPGERSDDEQFIDDENEGDEGDNEEVQSNSESSGHRNQLD